MLKTTRLFEVLAPKAFGADDDEVVGGGCGGANETIDKSAKIPKNRQRSKANLPS